MTIIAGASASVCLTGPGGKAAKQRPRGMSWLGGAAETPECTFADCTMCAVPPLRRVDASPVNLTRFSHVETQVSSRPPVIVFTGDAAAVTAPQSRAGSTGVERLVSRTFAFKAGRYARRRRFQSFAAAAALRSSSAVGR